MIRTLLIALALAACPASAPPPSPVGPPSAEPTPVETSPSPTPMTAKADGASCLTPEECQSGVCEGEGCDANQPGVCAPKSRGCTRDLRPYCGCDGQTFRTSGSCPGKRFSARAECP